MPWKDDEPFYLGKHPGDTVQFLIRRNGETIDLKVRLIKPPIGPNLVTVLVTILVALIFWGWASDYCLSSQETRPHTCSSFSPRSVQLV
jgi:hypothetical protein